MNLTLDLSTLVTMTVCLPSSHNQPLGCMVDTYNAFSNHPPFKLGVEDTAFCANLQWSLQPHTQEKAHLQVML
jgi:hypothetical protein